MIVLRPITLDECQTVRVWRNAPDVMPMLRTGYKTEEQQERFYYDIVCNAYAEHRYWAIESEGQFIGIGGMTYLDREPGEAEISLVLGPQFRGKGHGRRAVKALLVKGFSGMGLNSIIGECYSTGAVQFWATQALSHRPVVLHLLDSGALYWRWYRV